MPRLRRETARAVRTLFASFLAVIALATAHAQTTIAEWTFTGDVTTPSTGSGTAGLVGGATATFAAGFTGAPDRGWNTSTYPAQGTGSKTRGVEFAVSTAGYTGIRFRFDLRHSNTSANTAVVQYSTTGCTGTFTDAATFTVTAGDAWYSRDVDLTGVAALNNNANACFRVVSAFAPPGSTYVAANPSSTYATSGTMRYDNVRIYSQPPVTDVPPSITAVTPANGATNVPTSSTITLTFSEAVDVASGGLTLVCASTPQAFSGLPASNVTTLTLTPSAALPAGAGCTLTVQANAVTDRDGSADPMAADFTSSFTTAPATPTNTPPTITADPAFSPRLFVNAASPSRVSGVISDPTDPARTVGIRFNIADAETAASALTVTATSSNTTVVPASGLAFSGSGAQRVLTITPAAVGTSTITVTLSDGTDTAIYTIEYAASAASTVPAQSRFITGACDASTAARIDNDAFVIANDEDQRLRVFPTAGSGGFLGALDVTALLGLTDVSGGQPREVDIEASARVGNRIYWLASHGNSSGGASRPNRSRLFATDVSGSGTAATLSFVGYYANLKADLIAWDDGNGHGLGAGALGLAASAATGLAPEASGGNGFNIEGLTFAPDNATAWIAFRAPLQNTSVRNRALLIPVTNFTALVSASPAAGPAAFGVPVLLDLGGRAIRSIDRAADGRYLIVAGPHDAVTGVAPKDFRLFRWSGNPADAPEMFLTDLTARAAVGSYEGIVRLPSSLLAGQTVELLTDEGDTNFYGTGTICKELPNPEWMKARVETFTLEGPVTRIHAVQGAGPTSPLVGQTVTVEGIVTGDFQGTGQLGGYFIQEPDALADADPMTSEGIFVFHTATAVNVGDLVRVTGTVVEFAAGTGTLTQITPSAVQVLSSGQPLPTPVTLTLPVPSMAHFEALEGMRVTIAAPLTVSDNYNLARFGELTLAPSRLMIPTDSIDPNDDPASGTTTSGGSNVAAVTAAIDLVNRSRILLDDASNVQNPPAIPYWDASTNTLRVGSQVTALTGVLSFGFSAYRIQPTAPVSFSFAPRPVSPPAVGGSLKVASFNVLNFFNGDGAGGGFPTSRGATNATELTRQTAKTVAAINTMDAAVTGLMEMENDGDGPASAIKTLTDALNTAAGSAKWDYVRDPAGYTSLPGGTDEIKVAFLYQPTLVTPVGPAQACNSSAFSNGRAPVAQLFEHTASGGRFIAVVNHFKSKSTGTPPTGADVDQNDGQGAYNASRKAQAAALVACVNAWRTALGDDDVLLIGDFNAYKEEDPMDTFRAAGLTVLDKGAHSYVFEAQSGSLDHAVASPALLPQVTQARAWHINADEPRILDYNLEFKGGTQSPDYYTPTPWRSSDHDPVLVGLALAADSAAVSVEPATVVEGATASVTVRLSRAIARDAVITWNAAVATGDTASAADFSAGSGSITIPAGQTTGTIMIATTQDALIEGNETFTVTLTSASTGLTLATASARITIVDDDGAQTVVLSVAPSSVGEASATPITFTLTRAGGSAEQRAEALAVSITPPPSSARHSSTCAATLTIPAHQSTASCSVMPIDNALVDGDVSVSVTVQAGAGYTVSGAATATATITDDDAATRTLTGLAVPGSTATASVTFTAQGGCGIEVTTARFVALGATAVTTPAPITGPVGMALPYGLFEFDARTCVGGSVEVAITFPGAVTSAMKWGYATPGATAPSWFSVPAATYVGSVLRFVATDGGALDNDRTANGRIIDPVAVVQPAAGSTVVPVPTTGAPLLALMMLALAGMAGIARRSLR
jgi:predicted extracellular nuclease